MEIFGVKFPTVLQNSYTECGLACVVSVLRGFNHYATLRDLHEQVQVSNETSGKDLCLLLNRYKVKSSPIIFEDVQDVSVPAILHWQGIHFVLLTKKNKRTIEIMDPSAGRLVLPIKYARVHLQTKFAIEVEKKDDFVERVAQKSIISLSKIFFYLASHKQVFTSIVLTGIIAKIFILSIPYYAHLIIDEVIGKSDFDLMVLLITAFSISSVFSGISNYSFSRSKIFFKNKINLISSVSIIEEIVNKKIQYFQSKIASDIVSRVREMDAMINAVSELALSFIPEVIVIIASAIAMYLYAPALAFTVVFIGIIFAVLAFVYAELIKRKQLRAITSKVEEESHNIDICVNIEMIKSFALNWSSVEKFKQKRSSYLNSELSLELTKTQVELLFQGMFQVQNIVILSLAVYLYFNNDEASLVLTLGSLFAFLFVKNLFFESIKKLFLNIIEVRGLRSILNRLDEMLLEPKENDRFNETYLNYSVFKEDLKIQNMSFKWSSLSNDYTLKNINLNISHGEKVVIMGPSGEGKSTLLKFISRLYEDETRSICLGNTVTEDIPLNFYRENVLYLPPNELLDQSIYDNVALDKEISLDEVKTVLESLKVWHVIQKNPMGLNMQAKRSGVSISSGEKQKLSLAKVFLSEAKIKLLDEPTAFLDAESRDMITELIINDPATIICATHDIKLAQKYFDCHYHFQNGSLVKGLPFGYEKS